MIAFVCPACQHTNQAPPSAAGRKGRCAKCKDVIVVPRAARPPVELPARLRRNRGAPQTQANKLLQLTRTTRLSQRAGFECRECGTWTALDQLALNGTATCPECQGEAWDLDVVLFAKEQTSVGPLNVLLLFTGTLSMNVREAIE